MTTKARLDNDKTNPCQPLSHIIIDKRWNNGWENYLLYKDGQGNYIDLETKYSNKSAKGEGCCSSRKTYLL